MRVAIAFSHKGLRIREEILKKLKKLDIDYDDLSSLDSHYPDLALAVGRAVTSQSVDRGILVDGTGMGMCIAANKIRGIRAIACLSSADATEAREKYDANVLCLGSELEGNGPIVKHFLETPGVSEKSNHFVRLQRLTKLLDAK